MIDRRQDRSRGRQPGIALLEALIAFLVLAIGLLMIGRLQVHLRLGADLSRQRSEAVRLAQMDTEKLRSFTVVAASAPAMSFDDIESETRTVDPVAGDPMNTRYHVVRQVESPAAPKMKVETITASWSDRSGVPRQVVLNSMIAGIDPAYTGSIGLLRANGGIRGAAARSPAIPVFAKDLGDDRSAFKPVGNGTVAYFFNNLTGAVSICTGVASDRTTSSLTIADLAHCNAHFGLLLSGIIRFSSASPPDILGHEEPLAANISLTLSLSSNLFSAVCMVEAAKTVSYAANGSQHVDTVPAASTAASLGLTGWLETGDRYATYYCVVPPASSGFWSGRATVQPAGWTIGTGAADHRVCRYSTDLDHNGKIDAVEHPDTYVNVGVDLIQQNYLVIPGPDTCPGVGVTTAQQSP